MPELIEIYPFAVSLLIGLIVGIERERSHTPDTQSAGVRTFVLIGLLGALAVKLGDPLIAVVFGLFTASIIVAGYIGTAKSDPASDLGITTEISAMCTYGLGMLSGKSPGLALLLGGVLFAVLYSRTWLHRFSREILQPGEIRAVLILALILVGIIPLLPVEAVDPWGIIRLRSLGKVIAALLVIQFASHIAIRAFGDKIGILLTSFLGGFVSSTSVFLTLPGKLKKDPSLFRLLCAAALLATIATLIEVLIILFMIDPSLLSHFAIPVIVMIMTAGVFVIGFSRRQDKVSYPDSSTNSSRALLKQNSSPIELASVLKLSAVISLMLVAVSISTKWLGPTAATATAFFGALFELHGVTYSTAELLHHGTIAREAAIVNIAVAIVAAFISKLLILIFLNRGRFAFVVSSILLLMVAVGTGALILNLSL